MNYSTNLFNIQKGQDKVFTPYKERKSPYTHKSDILYE